MKKISIFILGFAMSCASAAAIAQDLTAGKTPAQLFHSDCAECHRSPGSVAGSRDVHALAAFLREHYTTRSETAGALAAYVSSFAGTGAAARNRGTGVATPASGEPPPARRRNRGEGDATAARSNASPIEDTAPRRRRSGLSGDVDTRRARNDRDVARPPGVIAAAPAAAKSNARTRKGEPRDASAPVSRLRSYLPSGREAESGNVEAGKAAGPKARKRRNVGGDVVPPAAEGPAQTKANEVLTAPDPVPRQGTVSPPAASPLP